jgi:OOP family OmpA-OmpF porin
MMTPLEELVENVKTRLPLGAAAGPLLQSLLGILFSGPNGLKGFLDKLNASGLGAQAQSWIGKADAPPLSPQGARHAFGADAIANIASKAGIDPGIVTAALAYATPKIIGLLTAGGSIPTAAPASVATFLGSSPSPSAAPSPSPSAPPPRPAPSVTAPTMAGGSPAAGAGMRRWLLPAILAVLALALLSHFMGGRNEPTPAAPAAEHN